MTVVISLLAAGVSLLFGLSVLKQYRVARKPHQLVWAMGLLLYFLATLSQGLVGGTEVNPTLYRLWYLAGAVMVAAYLGMGTLYLLAPRRIAHIIMAILGAATLFALWRVFSAPVDLSQLVPDEPLTGKAFPSGLAGPRLLTPFFNIFGSLALIGGALYSALVYWRRRDMPHRVVSNILIAIGAFLPAAGGTFSRLGYSDAQYILQLLGIVIIYIGFRRSR